jgi:two-component system cell cycle response regulator DivK
VQLILEATGRYMVLGAADGLAGLDLVREKRPVLVLVDLDLPLIDGFELIKRIRLDPELRAIPLVAVSASVMHRERQRSLDAGCMAFVEKPFDVVAFRDLVDDCIRRAWDRER